jgi:hypothetical protein
MIHSNFLVLLIAAAIPMVIGMLWYSPLLFAKVWMKEANITMGEIKPAKFALILATAFLFSIMIANVLQYVVIHQLSLSSIVSGLPKAEQDAFLSSTMQKYGQQFRTFQHGALHGFIFSLFAVLPLIGMHCLYENKSVKYVLIHLGYWSISLMLMGGVICQWT